MLVGPGTGLAPFRGFLQERKALKAKGESMAQAQVLTFCSPGKDIGEAVLYFGCQNEAKHYLYREVGHTSINCN